MAEPPASAHGPRLPPAVAVLADEHRRRLTPTAARTVLDLDDPAARALVARTATDRAGGAPVSEGYDLIVSTAQLVRFPDLAAAIGALARLLAPGGVVVLVEPTARPVPGGLLLGSAWSHHRAVSGTHVNRDVPAALRSSPLTFCDLERITMPTRIWPLRTFVALTAERAPEPALAPTSAGRRAEEERS